MGKNYSFRSGKIIANTFRIKSTSDTFSSSVRDNGEIQYRAADGKLRFKNPYSDSWETVYSS